MELSKSIDFLLENAGPVIQYRLHKEILKDVSKNEEENLLEKVKQTPYYKLVERYVKPNGYIGLGMHSWDKFKETPLQDGEAAARLLANYSIPKESEIIENYIKALRDKNVMDGEFSYYNPEIARFRDRYLGLKNGGGLMVLIYSMQALLGYGDDKEVKPFVDISLKAFQSMLSITALDEITNFKPYLKKRYNYPYIEEDDFLPCSYHLTTLSRTYGWREDNNIIMLSNAINHINHIMKEDNNVHVKIRNNYYTPLWAFIRPFKAFETDRHDVALRKTLTELAMLGVGERVDIIKKSVENIKVISADGILRVKFDNAYHKKKFIDNMRYPGPYSEIGLEENYKKDMAIWCDLTFWAVQLLNILNQTDPI